MISAQHAYVPMGLPSPTLTNPDMILPYNSPPSPSSSSLMPSESQQYPTQSLHSKSRRSEDDDEGNLKRSMRRLFSNGVISPRRDPDVPIPSIKSRDTNVRMDNSEPNQSNKERLFLSPSPTSEDDYPQGDNTGHDHPGISNGHWDGFDGPTHNVATDSYDDVASGSPQMIPDPGYGIPPAPDSPQGIRAILEEDEDDPYSHAGMSKRAEFILANAKKRLLVSRQCVCSAEMLLLTRSRQWRVISTVHVMVFTAGLLRRCHLSRVRVRSPSLSTPYRGCTKI